MNDNDLVDRAFFCTMRCTCAATAHKAAGFERHLVKPVNPDEVARVVAAGAATD